jgi:hypothetical protein
MYQGDTIGISGIVLSIRDIQTVSVMKIAVCNLVTGGTEFISGHSADVLQEGSCNVIAL